MRPRQTSLLDVSWVSVRDGNDTAFSLIENHYSFRRYRDGRRHIRFVGPGERMVLVTPDASAIFIWSKQKFRADDQSGVICGAFRNEGSQLSSDLIRDAVKLAWERWPGERLYTYINPKKDPPQTRPGTLFPARRLAALELVQKGTPHPGDLAMKTKLDPTPAKIAPSSDNANLTLLSEPANLLDIVRRGSTGILPTKQLNIFYCMADSIERAVKVLKDRCRPVIIGRRNEGEPTGSKLQHRTFTYKTPQGDITLTVQERLMPKPNPEKLEALLRAKKLLEIAQTTSIDMNKVDGLVQAGLITAEEMSGVCDEAKPVYALIAQFEAKK